jgi:peptidoglycan/xylan/chitin deacetylase (PgdA/CDA1 family)
MSKSAIRKMFLASLFISLGACSDSTRSTDPVIHGTEPSSSLFEAIMNVEASTEELRNEKRSEEAMKHFVKRAHFFEMANGLLARFDENLETLYQLKLNNPEQTIDMTTLETQQLQMDLVREFGEENQQNIKGLYIRLLQESNNPGSAYYTLASLALQKVEVYIADSFKTGSRAHVAMLVEDLKQWNERFLEQNPTAKVPDLAHFQKISSTSSDTPIEADSRSEETKLDPMLENEWRNFQEEAAVLKFQSSIRFNIAGLTFFPSPSRNGTLDGDEFPSGVWAMTLDDGPHPSYTPKMMKVLSAAGMRATFFWLSQNILSYPAVVQAAGEAGFRRGSHSFTHKNLQKLSEAGLNHEIDDAVAVFKASVHERPSFFRCPYGNCGKSEGRIRAKIAAQQMMNVTWNVDSLDWHDRNPSSIFARILKQMKVRGHGIILMHDVHPQSVEALKLLVAYFTSHPELKTYTMDEIMKIQTGHEYHSP